MKVLKEILVVLVITAAVMGIIFSMIIAGYSDGKRAAFKKTCRANGGQIVELEEGGWDCRGTSTVIPQ